MNARLSSDLVLRKRNVPVLPQSAALCYRIENGRPKILLVTSRQSRRWIIPKGWLIDGLNLAETAAQEAWEEAGVTGRLSPRSLGQFTYVKDRPGTGPVLCMVEVYPLHVQSIASRFPECDERKRKWFSPKKAAGKVTFPEVAEILHRFRVYPH